MKSSVHCATRMDQAVGNAASAYVLPLIPPIDAMRFNCDALRRRMPLEFTGPALGMVMVRRAAADGDANHHSTTRRKGIAPCRNTSAGRTQSTIFPSFPPRRRAST